MTPDDVRSYLDWSDEQLLAEIGRTFEERDWLPKKFENLVRDGRAWMDKNFALIREKVCSNAATRANDDPAVTIAAIADTLSGAFGHISAVTAAVLVYRFGIHRLCGNDGDDLKR